jgi:hypothetical protein
VVLDALDQLNKKKKYVMSIETEYAKKEFMYYPIVKALLDLNIVFKSKYYDLFYVEHYFYGEVLDKFVREKKEGMNRNERLKYRFFRLTKGIKFGNFTSSVPVKK